MAVLILDIDGVFNPFYARGNAELAFIEHTAGGYIAFLKPDFHKPWIEKLTEHATPVWGSAWAEKSNLILEMLGIPQKWDWIPLDTEDVGLGTWKIKSVRRWVEQNVPPDEKVVWVDDELEEDAPRWAAERGNMLTVAPPRHQGLSEEQFQAIHDFLTT